MPVVLLVVAAFIVAGVVAVAIGRGGELAPAPADYAPIEDREITSTDVAVLHPPIALWGYQRDATDAALGQIARLVSAQEVQIATLQRQLADLLPVRLPGARPAPSWPGAMDADPVGIQPMGAEPAGTELAGTEPGGTEPGGTEPVGADAGPSGWTSPGWTSPGWTSQDWTLPDVEPLAAPPVPPLPARPSVLQRELADQPATPDPAPAADPWSPWQRGPACAAGPGGDPGPDTEDPATPGAGHAGEDPGPESGTGTDR